MVVRTGGVKGSAFLIPRLWHKGVARTVRGVTSFPSADRARRNAQVAAASMARRRREREEADDLLTAHAAPAHRRSAGAV
jgi:hypothetical protein